MLVCRFVRQYSLRAMSGQLIIHDLWIGSIVLQVALALALLATRAWRNFPAFAAYIFFCLFEAGITYALFENKKAYFCAFWICEAIGIVLGLAVVREIFTKVFSPHPALRKLATIIFRVAVIALVLLACAVIYVQSASATGLVNAVLLAAEAARLVEVGLIMFLFLSSSVFGLHWRQNVFGIALGLGMFAAVDLITVTLIGHMGSTTQLAFKLVRGISFSTSLLIWLGYLLVPERATSSGELPKKAQLEQWNQAVTELINR